MRKIFFLLIICTPVLSFGQTRLSNDTLYLNDSITLVKGQSLNLGAGSNMATREFNFITTAPSPLIHTINLGAGYAGTKMLIKGFKVSKSRRTGNKYYVILGGGNIINYWCDILPAINLKEVIP